MATLELPTPVAFRWGITMTVPQSRNSAFNLQLVKGSLATPRYLRSTRSMFPTENKDKASTFIDFPLAYFVLLSRFVCFLFIASFF